MAEGVTDAEVERWAERAWEDRRAVGVPMLAWHHLSPDARARQAAAARRTLEWAVDSGAAVLPSEPSDSERLARAFHETYERLAPDHGYTPRQESSVAWNRVPANNKSLMLATAASILEQGWTPPARPDPAVEMARAWQNEMHAHGTFWLQWEDIAPEDQATMAAAVRTLPPDLLTALAEHTPDGGS